MTAAKIKVTAIQTPSPDNTVMVARQLKESVEVGQRLRGDPQDSFVRVAELTQGGLWKLVNDALVPGTVSGGGAASITVANSIAGAGTVASPLQLQGDSGSPGNSMLYGTNGSGVKGWYAQPAGGTSTLASLSDVSISTPADGQVLTYVASASKWENQPVANARVKIAETVLSVAAATISFSSIPGGYRNLIIQVCGQGSAASSSGLFTTINSDTGANYRQAHMFNGTASGGGTATGGAVAPSGQNLFGIASSTSIGPSYLRFVFPLYAGTAFTKLAHVDSARIDSSTAYFVQQGVLFWNSTAAIVSILFSLSSGNFVAGTTATLYGET